MSNRSDKRTLRRETYPLPEGTEAVVALVEEVLSAEGPVHKILLEESQPIRVYRWVKEDRLAEPQADIEAALRNVDLFEYDSGGGTPFEALWDMMALVKAEQHWPICLVTGIQEDLLSSWFQMRSRGRPWTLEDMFALPVYQIQSLSEDTLILCGADFKEAEPEDMTIAVKTAIEMRKNDGDSRSTTSDQVRNDPYKHTSAAGEVETSSGGSSSGWSPAGFFVDWMGDSGRVR